MHDHKLILTLIPHIGQVVHHGQGLHCRGITCQPLAATPSLHVLPTWLTALGRIKHQKYVLTQPFEARFEHVLR